MKSRPEHHTAILGCSISGRRCSAGNRFLYPNAWFRCRYAKRARLRPGFNWWPQVALERSRRFGIAANVRWPSARVRRVESRGDAGVRFACAHCRPEGGRRAFRSRAIGGAAVFVILTWLHGPHIFGSRLDIPANSKGGVPSGILANRQTSKIFESIGEKS